MAKHYRVPSAIVSAIVGVGSRKLGNTGGDFPLIAVTDAWANPPVVPTSEGATCNLVATVAASADAAGVDLTIVAEAEALLRNCPRNLAIWASAAQTEDVDVTGYDQFGNAQTETITFNGNDKVEGTKVWGRITTIHQDQRSGAANIGIGFGSLFGTSRKLVAVDHGAVFVTATGKYASVKETTDPLKATTASVHAVSFTTAIAATNTYVVHYFTDEAR